MTGGGAITTGWTMGAGRPKMPVPEMIWLNTANAPRPRAASVDEPANASPGDSSIAIMTTAAVRLIVSPPCRPPGVVECCGSSRPLDGGCRAPIYGWRFLTTTDACGATRGTTDNSGLTISRDVYRQPKGADGSWMASR